MKTLLLGQTKLSIKLKNDTVFKILLQFAEEILNIDLVLATSGSSIDVVSSYYRTLICTCSYILVYIHRFTIVCLHIVSNNPMSQH